MVILWHDGYLGDIRARFFRLGQFRREKFLPGGFMKIVVGEDELHTQRFCPGPYLLNKFSFIAELDIDQIYIARLHRPEQQRQPAFLPQVLQTAFPVEAAGEDERDLTDDRPQLVQDRQAQRDILSPGEGIDSPFQHVRLQCREFAGLMAERRHFPCHQRQTDQRPCAADNLASHRYLFSALLPHHATIFCRVVPHPTSGGCTSAVPPHPTKFPPVKHSFHLGRCQKHFHCRFTISALAFAEQLCSFLLERH